MLTIKKSMKTFWGQWRRFEVFAVNLEQISHIILTADFEQVTSAGYVTEIIWKDFFTYRKTFALGIGIKARI